MAETLSVAETARLVSQEEKNLAEKREAVDGILWKPAGGYNVYDNHGSGVVPEHIWLKFSPNSDPDTAAEGGLNV